jgi:hypothetical protein
MAEAIRLLAEPDAIGAPSIDGPGRPHTFELPRPL